MFASFDCLSFSFNSSHHITLHHLHQRQPKNTKEKKRERKGNASKWFLSFSFFFIHSFFPRFFSFLSLDLTSSLSVVSIKRNTILTRWPSSFPKIATLWPQSHRRNNEIDAFFFVNSLHHSRHNTSNRLHQTCDS